jgi:hypothetical protein
MTKDLPDYESFETVFHAAAGIDLAELAVRLGSKYSYDRRGNVLSIEDFEDTTEKYQKHYSGTGAAAARSTDYAHVGNYSIKLTAGSDELQMAGISKWHTFPRETKLGYLAWWNYISSSPEKLDYIIIEPYIYTGRELYLPALKYDLADETMSVRTGLSTYEVVKSGLEYLHAATLFHPLKLVFDWANKIYLRAYFEEKEIDLSAYSIYGYTLAYPAHTIWYFSAYSVSGQNAIVYLDDIVITEGEP